MKNIPNKQEVEDAFERVIESKLFKRSLLQERILRYLIDQAIEGNDIKEQSIGIDLLKDKYEADQNNSKIRVYVFHLRKKLAEYYSDIGKDEKVIFYIEKGQYNLTFETKLLKPEFKEKSYFTFNISKKIVLITFGLIVSVVLLLFLLNRNEPSYFWKPFLTKKSETVCIVADHFMVSDVTNIKKHTFFTNAGINSNQALIDYNKKNPELNLESGGFTMITKMAPFGVNYLGNWFHKYNSSFNIQLESDSQYEDYIKNNIVYIGQYKSMVESKPFFLKNSKVFKADTDGFSFTENNETFHFNAKHGKVANNEYAMVSYQKLGNEKYALFFVSNHDIGVLATIKMFTSEGKIKLFIENFTSKNVEFNALFIVSGLKRTDFNCELVELEIIE